MAKGVEQEPSWLVKGNQTAPADATAPLEAAPSDPVRRNVLKVGVLYPVWATVAGLFGGWQIIGGWEKTRATKELAESLSETSASLDKTKEVLAQTNGKNTVLQVEKQGCQKKLGEETSSLQTVIAELRAKLGEAENRGSKLQEDLGKERSERAHWQATAVISETQKRVLVEALKGEINPQTLVEAGEAVALSVPLKVVDDIQNLAGGVKGLVATHIEDIKKAAIPLAELAEDLNNKIFPIAKFGDKIINVLRKFNFQAVGSIIDTAVSILKSVDQKTKKKFPLVEESKLLLMEMGEVLKGQKEIPVTPLEHANKSALEKIEEADNKLSAKTTDPVIDQVGKQITEYAQGIDTRLGKWAEETTERLTKEKEGRKAKSEAANRLSEFIGKNQDMILTALVAKRMEVTPENSLKVAQDLMGK